MPKRANMLVMVRGRGGVQFLTVDHGRQAKQGQSAGIVSLGWPGSSRMHNVVKIQDLLDD